MNTTVMTRTVAATLVALAISFGASTQALAHKVVAGAYASGDHIEGEIGFSDGSVAKNQPVDVLAEDGSKIGETKTGEDGTFTFKPTKPIVHIFHADMGGGHIANIRIEVADLPVDLAAAGAAGGGAAVGGGAAPAAAADATTAAASAATAVALSDAQKTLLLQAVSNEIKPLRKEIIALKEKDDLQSILGGIGYIAGLFGLWFYVSARRSQSKQTATMAQPSVSAQRTPKTA
ncbi:nickel transport protein [Roseiarcus fermentans]|uniref:Nickel transport protein n=1 Tax=Roseiarcus fermentans TaxID=1473586 RepID=A0A366FEX6_9HYPH|nr:cobalt ABC transporter permease [Roseiarcus fermentans]RBP13177.1 nickel transport protein [Roseiarcus fermentans]